MRAGQRVAASLLCTIVLFAAFAFFAFSGLFDVVESRFYRPMVVQGIEKRLEKVALAQEKYAEILFRRFETFAKNESVRTFAQSRPSDESVKERERRRVELILETRALKGIRVIDSAGINVLYSSFTSDIMSESAGQTKYRKYSELVARFPAPEIPYTLVRAGESDSYRIFRDGSGNRLVISLPFRDSADKFVGTIAFYVDSSDLNRFLYDEKLIDITGFGELIADATGFGGYAFSLPNAGRKSAESAILENWSSGFADEKISLRPLVPELPAEMEGIEPNRQNLVVFSTKNRLAGYSAWVYDADTFAFPDNAKILLLLLAFLTLLIIVFFFFSLFKDDLVIIRDRIKRFQLAFVLEAVDSETLPPDLLEQKNKINSEIRKSLGRRGRRHAKDVDALLESSWEQIFTALGVRGKNAIDSDELRRVLVEVLGNGIPVANVAPVAPEKIATPAEPPKEMKVAVEDVSNENEEIEEAESVEKVEDAEEAEPAEEIEEVEEAESVEEVEEAESVEDVEDAEEAEPADEENLFDGEFVSVSRKKEKADENWISSDDFPEDDENSEPTDVFDGEEQAQDGSFAEQLRLSSPEPVKKNPEGDKIAEKFSASSLDFDFLDSGDLNAIKTDELIDFVAEEIEPIEKPFTFAPFGSGSVSDVEEA